MWRASISASWARLTSPPDGSGDSHGAHQSVRGTYYLPNRSAERRWERTAAIGDDIEGHTATSYQPPVRVALRSEIERAAALFEGKRKIVILAGSGARGATDELLQIAERLSPPIAKPLLGKDVVPDDSQYTTGRVGLLG